MMWKKKKIQVNEYKETKADKIIESVFIFGLSSILLLTFFLAFFTTGHCAETQTYFPFLRNQNGTIPSTVIDYCNSNWGDSYYYFLGQYHATGNSYDNGPILYAVRVPKSSGVFYASTNDYRFSLYYNGSLQGLQIGFLAYYRNQWNWSSMQGGLTNTNFQNRVSPSYYNQVDFYSNFDLYNGDPSLSSSQPVMLMFMPNQVVPGQATQPTTPTQPGNKPQAPTNNTYTWTQTPNVTIDNTDVLHLLGSFISVFTSYVVWLCENIEGFFTTLFGNIFVWFQYFANLVNYWADAIWTIIKDFMMNFFDNMASLFEPIANNIKSIVEFCGTGVLGGLFDFLNPDDDTSLPDLFDSLDFSSIVNAINNYTISFQDIFDYFDDYKDAVLQNFSKIFSFFAGIYSLGLGSDNEFHLTTFISNLIIPDSTQFVNMLIQHDEFNMHTAVFHVVDEIEGFYTTVSNYQNYSVKTITMPSTVFMDKYIPSYTIDFSWFDDYKTFTDTIISAFLIVGWFAYILTRLSGILRGNQPTDIK